MSRGTEPTPVTAVVVTYNRPADLASCLEALGRQSRPPERILVVDNGSSPPVALPERSGPTVNLLRLEANSGPAGGFTAGFEAAVERGCRFVWAMDDDVLPNEDCLEGLLETAGQREAELVFPTIVDRQGKVTNFPGWSAVLVSAEAVRRAGLPRKELFWWIEDTEYLQWRLPQVHGVVTARADGVRAMHDAAKPGARPGAKPAWKVYYETRNTVYYRLWVQTTPWPRRWWRCAVVLSRTLVRTVLLEPDKLRKLRYLARGLRDGLAGRLGKTVDPAQG